MARKNKSLLLFITLLIIVCIIAVFAYFKRVTNSKELPEDGGEPSLELIKSNMEKTDLTAKLKVEDVVKKSKEDGYTFYVITGVLEKVYVGDQNKGDTVKITKVVEFAEKPYVKGDEILGSFEKKGDGEYMVPDVAYDFLYSQALENKFDEAVKQLK